MRTRSRLLESLALAILLSIGAGLVWGFLCGWGASVVSDSVSSGVVHEQLTFLSDGTPIIESYVGRDYQRRTLRTLSGKEVRKEANGARNMFDSGSQLAGPKYRTERFYGLPWRGRIVCVLNDWYGDETWYFVHDGKLQGHGWFVGYDKMARAKIGYIGRGGFRTDEPPIDQQFSVDGHRMSGGNRFYGTALIDGYNSIDGPQYLLADDGLMEINLKKRSVAVVRKGADLISGRSSRIAQPPGVKKSENAKATPEKPIILLRTPDRVLVLGVDGKKIEEFPLPPELREVNLQWITLPGGKALARECWSGSELSWLDTSGKIVRREHVKLHDPRQSELMTDVTVSLVAPTPACIAGVVVCYPWAPAECPESWDYSAAFRQALARTWPILLATGIISVILACVCYRRQRKYGLPWTGVWTIFVLLFGLPAFFGYLAHRAWPARLPCPHCGSRAPRDRPACFACGRDFPAPAAKGIEVFA